MDIEVIVIYLFYITISIAVTIWVARTLHKNGLVFLLDAFHGDKEKAQSVNHLLVVGFYLINLGFISLFLSAFDRPTSIVTGIEYIATKIGIVLMVLGAMHFFNIFNFNKMRRKALMRQQYNTQMNENVSHTP